MYNKSDEISLIFRDIVLQVSIMFHSVVVEVSETGNIITIERPEIGTKIANAVDLNSVGAVSRILASRKVFEILQNE